MNSLFTETNPILIFFILLIKGDNFHCLARDIKILSLKRLWKEQSKKGLNTTNFLLIFLFSTPNQIFRNNPIKFYGLEKEMAGIMYYF